MEWVWTVGAVWVLLGVGLALLIGRSIVLADRRAADPADAPNVVVDRPPLALLPVPADATAPGAGTGRAASWTGEPPQPRAAPREAPTIPGLPVARPPVGRPPVPQPRARRHRPHGRSDWG